MPNRKQVIRNQLILLHCQRGDERGFDELIAAWERPLLYYVRRLVESEEDAWDVLQEVWIRVARGIRGLRDAEAMTAWLYKIARNVAIDHLRRRPPVEPLGEMYEETLAADDGSDPIGARHDAESIHWALDQMPWAHREVLTLFFLEGFQMNEIAEIVGVPLGTVKSRLYYAKRAMRDLLEQEAGNHEPT